MDKDIEVWPSNYKTARIKISDGSVIQGKVNIGEFNRLSDSVKAGDEKFLVLVGTLGDENQEKTYIIHKDKIVWIQTEL